MRALKILISSLLLSVFIGVEAQEIEALFLKRDVPCSWGLAVGPDASLFCVDAFGPAVVKFDSEGTQLTTWGSEGTAAGEFQGPRGVAVDSTGRVYVADESNHRVQRFGADGSFEIMWGNDVLTGSGSEGVLESCTAGETCNIGLPSTAGFTYPHDVSVDPVDDTLIIADTAAARVVRLNPQTNELTVLFNSCDQGVCGQVLSAAIDANGVLYVTIDSNNVARYDYDVGSGQYTQTWLKYLGTGSLPTAHYVALDSQGLVYVTDSLNDRIQKFDANGGLIMMWGWGVATGADQFEICTESAACLPGIPWEYGDPDNPGQLNGPNGIAIDSQDYILIIDDRERLQKFGVAPSGVKELAKLLASDGAAYDSFGGSVAMDGGTVVIGAVYDNDVGDNAGSAYVFRWDGSAWVEHKLTASDGVAGDFFGFEVAVDGNIIIIGAPDDDDSAGSAYVFMWDGTSWVEQTKLTASDGAIGDIYGASIEADNNVIIIGALRDDDLGSNSGSAYIYRWNGTTWVEQPKLTASDGVSGDYFGSSVAVDGDIIVIGAGGDDDLGNDSGSVYVFVWDGMTWVEQPKLTASDGAAYDSFGWLAKVDGDVIVVGADMDDDRGLNSGSAYIFMWDGTTWVEQPKLTASDGSAGDYFGFSLAVDGDTVVIGARQDDDLGIDSGSVYVFGWDGMSWAEQSKLTASDGAAGDRFGYSLGLDGKTVIVGAYLDDDMGDDSGSAYVFSLLSNETPVGEGVIVRPPIEDESGDPIEDAPEITFTFSDVEEGGETTVVVTGPGTGTSSAPLGFRITGLTGAPVLFDIETTATLADDSVFKICIDFSGMDVAGNPDNVTLGHEVDGVWVDITTNNTGFVICGVADSFSYFAILESLGIVGPTDAIALSTEAVLGIDVGDPALTDTVHWQWGDGSPGTEVEATTSDIVTSHTYTEAGVYAVTATLLLAGVEAGSADFQYVVVFDPTAGFVTGGGWFNSPVGAYLADTDLVGRANFGFVSKYKKGAIIPTGTTEFQFKAGNLSFRSLEYQWLVIAGSRAQFKGVGTINGVGNFGFMLTAVDEALTPSTDVDLFRIKIWDIDNGDGVVYDNGLGDADDGDAATAIAGGSIVIHKVKLKK